MAASIAVSEERKSSKNRREIVRKSSKIVPKSMKNQRKFDLGPFWAFKAVSSTRRDALGTGSGRPKAALGAILGRPGRARGGRGRSKSAPGRVPSLPRTVPKRIRARSEHRGSSNALAERFFVVFVLSRESSDVPRVPVFTVFCWVRTKLARHARARRESSKIEAFRPPKTIPRPSKTRRNRARAAKTSAKSEVNPNFF